MKNMSKFISLFMAVVMIFSVMTTTVYAAITGTGDISDPIVCDTVADMPSTVTIPAGATLFFNVPAGKMQLTVVDDTTATNIVGPKGNTIAYTSNGNGVATVVFEEYDDGAVVSFGLLNQNTRADVTVEVSLGEATSAELGSEKNPHDANDFYFSMNRYYILNPQLEAGDSDGYWYVFKAEKSGILILENSSADGAEYQIMIDDGANQFLAFDGVHNNPITTYRLDKGTVVKINIYAKPDAANNIPATKVYASFTLVSGSETTPVSIKSEGFKAPVKSGDTVCYTDATRMAAYCGKGLVVSGYTPAIAETIVMVDNVEYIDEDGDGKIELPVSGGYSSRPIISITNNYKWNVSYTFTITDTAREGFCCPCGRLLDHIERIEPCHQNGTEEYWYCGACDVVYADKNASVITNRKNLSIEAVNELIHIEGVAPSCHYNGNFEYWYCNDCGYYYLDAEGVQSTNVNSVVLPATGCENAIHFEAVDPGCHYNGNIEYWYCPDCDGFWADEACTMVTNSKSVILPATGEGNVIHIDAAEPACHYKGNIEYWFCTDCEQFWADEALTKITNSNSVILPEAGSENVSHVEAVEPSCHEKGNVEYWFCADCEGFWLDEACTMITNSKSVILGATDEHVWADDFTIDREPTDEVDGEKSKHCTTEGCDARTEITAIYNRVAGDVDGDNDVTAADITSVINAMKGNGIADNKYADTDSDGDVTAVDITYVIQLMKA